MPICTTRAATFLSMFLIVIMTTPIEAKAQAFDDARVEQAIARMTTAYGGDALENLTSISLKIDRRLAWPGQGQTSDFVNYVADRQHKYFDLKAKHGSVERWVDQNGNVYHDRFAVDENGGAVIDYFAMTKRDTRENNYFRFFHAHYRTSDTMMAHLLASDQATISYAREETYQGNRFDVLAVEIAPETPRTDVYVSREDGLIHRMAIDRSIGKVHFLFSSHRQIGGGIVHAGEIRLFLGDQLVEYEHRLEVQINADVSAQIAVERDLPPPSDAVDGSAMDGQQNCSRLLPCRQGRLFDFC